MASRNLLEEQRIHRCKFTASLPSAVTEWVLILLLLLNGFISYLATKFAHFCQLQTPCIFCTRFDHILDSDSPSFFQTLICTSHKHKISSLAYCHTHRKLAVVHEMCEKCLLSIGNHKIPDPKIYRSLSIGITNKDHCSCCTKPFMIKSQDDRLHQTKGTNVVESNVKLLCLTAPNGPVKTKETNPPIDSHGHANQSKVSSDSSVYEATISGKGDGLYDAPPDHSSFGTNNLSVIHPENLKLQKLGGVHPVQFDAKYDVGLGKEEEEAYNPSTTIQVSKEILSSTKTNLKPNQTCSVHDDLRMLLSQISHGLDYPQNDMISTPRIRRQIFGEDFKLSRMQSMGRNEFSYESSLDGSRINDENVFNCPQNDMTSTSRIRRQIFREDFKLSRMHSLVGNEFSFDGSKMDDENVVDTLKRYFEFDRKSLILLYKELEEEQNASAIAAHETMAMITRLQDEKASMRMEALQYKRMMEEQSEYNQEVLCTTNTLVAEKEKKIQFLELELVTYRSRFGDDYGIEDTPRAKLLSSDGDKSPSTGDNVHEALETDKFPTTKQSLLDSEDEKIYILERLIDIEKKLHPSSIEDDGRIENSQLESRLNNKHGSTKQANLSDIGNEVNHLYDKLESLESDRCFLEYLIKSLQTGKEGLQFIQEVACHLREIRKIH